MGQLLQFYVGDGVVGSSNSLKDQVEFLAEDGGIDTNVRGADDGLECLFTVDPMLVVDY